MKLHDPANRLGKPVPYAESVQDFTLDGAREASRNCERCCGEGRAMIYSPHYRGSAVEVEADARTGAKQVLMRTTAFCVCPAGRKVAMLCQETSKDVFLRTPDYHDVVDGKYANWQTDDPTYDPTEAIDLEGLPESFKRLCRRLGLPHAYFEPDEPRLYVEREYDEPESQAAS